jgi:hypothetical protein
MAEQQVPSAKSLQSTPAAAGNPGGPQAATPPSVPVTPLPSAPAAGAAAKYVGLSYQQLRAIRDELSNQRQTLANRRDAISTSYERATGANREGIASRLTVLDANIVTLENQIADVGQRMANARPGTVSTEQPNGWNDGKVANMAFSVFLTTALITAYVMRRFARRRMNRVPQNQTIGHDASTERLDRIEQAVDTIAVEIERVSENQRFMTRLMTETQLAGTLAAVRSSAEAAKSEVGGSG